MKTKATLKITIFATTLIVSIALMNTFFSKNSFRFLGDKGSFKSKARVYNFLLAEEMLEKEYFSKSTALSLPKTPNAMEEFLADRRDIHRKYNEARLKADTTGLPDDFKQARTRFITKCSEFNDRFYSKNPDKADKTRKLIEISDELKLAETEYQRVANKYGFDIYSSGIIIDDEN